MAVPNILGIFLLISLLIWCECSANDILGCGGFVKSHANLDYSKIEIGLYTKDGSLKEKTECAPTNGYYFLPLYEKGEYVLRVHPPAGWSFEPAQVELAVDGEHDACSSGQDINFSFNGFGITGRVNTAGQTQGPAGVSVQLINEKGEKWETVTSTGGEYHFTPVIPGKYTVKASHPRWQLQPSQTVVQVKEGNTVMPHGSLTVKGYEVRGTVVSQGNPVSGFYVLLYSKEESPKLRVEGCTALLLQGVAEAPLCHVTTDASGEFTFGLVPGGGYRLVALARPPAQARLAYHVRPEEIPLLVQHDSLYIKDAFEIESVSVSGRVGVGGARVLLGGAAAAAADAGGRYTLRGLTAGDYVVSFEHEECEVEPVRLAVSASAAVSLPDAPVARWKVCGSVSPAGAHTVVITAERGGPDHTVAVADDGTWCTMLPRGEYSARVEPADRALQFHPAVQALSVAAAAVRGVAFSRLQAAVRGELRGAAGPPVLVWLEQPPGGAVMTTLAKDGKYEFTGVSAGAVLVRADGARRCWDRAALAATVAAAEVALPPLTQLGLRLPVRASHDVQLEYASGALSGSLRVRAAAAGSEHGCVPAPGRYTLRPRSCHVFDQEEYVVDVPADGDVKPLVLTARAHRQRLEVRAPAAAADVTLAVAVAGAAADRVGPLTPEADGDEFVYRHDLYLAEGVSAVVTPASEALLFSPTVVRVAGGAACGAGPALAARPARLVRGRVTPPVAGVEVTLTDEETGEARSVTTGADGAYRFAGVEAGARVRLSARAAGWALSVRGADVLARRLAELRVELADAGGAPLTDGVASVSGGAYRRTAALGDAVFAGLAPGQYYVKPQLKEHRAEPPHRLVDLADGEAQTVSFVGTRVAWSAWGTVRTLSGAGADVVVVAEPLEPAAAAAAAAEPAPRCVAERATPDAAGAFRIRGLLPACVYRLTLAAGAAPLRLVAPPPPLQITNDSDITGVRLVAAPARAGSDGGVLVRAAPEHYRALSLRLAGAGGAELLAAPAAPGPLLLPRLPAERRAYVLALRCSAPPRDRLVHFTADGAYKNFTFDFAPEARAAEQELRRSSLLLLALLGAAAAAFLHRERLVDAAVRAAGRALAPRRAAPARAAPPRPALDAASIDHIVSAVNAAGRRPARRKPQLAM